MASIVQWLRKGSDNCAWLGSGTQAIMLLLEEGGFSNKYIAVPVNVCPSVIQAILYSGNLPYYVDIDESRLGIAPESLERIIDDVSAVVAVHAYGSPCRIKEIMSLCQRKQKFLIEDCAQALGASVGGRPVGAFGDASIFSFGAGKIIDLGYGGAAVSEDKGLIEKLENRVFRMPKRPKESNVLISNFNSLHTAIYNLFYPSKTQHYAQLLLDAVLNVKTAYLFQIEDEFIERIEDSFRNLENNLSIRKIRALRFKALFEKAGLRFYWPDEGSVFWRFNVFLEVDRDRILRLLLSEGYKVSSWYPPANLFFETGGIKSTFPIGEKVGAEILNLWVNKEVEDSYAEAISKQIIEYSKPKVKTGSVVCE